MLARHQDGFESRCILCQFSAVSCSFTRASQLEQCPVVCNSAKIYYKHVSQKDMRPVVTDTEQYKSTYKSQPSV